MIIDNDWLIDRYIELKLGNLNIDWLKGEIVSIWTPDQTRVVIRLIYADSLYIDRPMMTEYPHSPITQDINKNIVLSSLRELDKKMNKERSQT